MIWFQLAYVLFGVSVLAGVAHGIRERRRGEPVVDVVTNILCGPVRSFLIVFGFFAAYACVGAALFA